MLCCALTLLPKQEKQLMRLEELVLVLWPVAGMDGWDAYAEIANDGKRVLAQSVERVKFSCEITISFESYHHALMNVNAATSFASSSSSSGITHLHSKAGANKTQEAIKSAFSSLAD